MEKGDKVTIVPNDNHPEYVKKHYGKTLEIEEVKTREFINMEGQPSNENYYKVKGIWGYARETDLQLIEE